MLSLEAEEEAGGEVLDILHTVNVLRVIAATSLIRKITWNRMKSLGDSGHNQ